MGSTLNAPTLQPRSSRLNILDTHGYADAVGEVRAGLRAADAALFVVSASEGVDPATPLLWDECEAVGMPRAIVITKADHDEADVVEGSVTEDLIDGTSMSGGDPQTAGAPEDMAVLLAGQANGGGVDDRKHLLQMVERLRRLDLHDDTELIGGCRVTPEW